MDELVRTIYLFPVTEMITNTSHRVSILQQWDHPHCSPAMKSCSHSRDVLVDCPRWGLRNGPKQLDHQRVLKQKMGQAGMDILLIR